MLEATRAPTQWPRPIQGDAAPSPFHLSAGTEPASGEAPKRKILGVRGQSPCATACFRSESRRPLIMRALAFVRNRDRYRLA